MTEEEADKALHLAVRVYEIISHETDDDALMLHAFTCLFASIIKRNETEDHGREEIAANIMASVLRILNNEDTVH